MHFYGVCSVATQALTALAVLSSSQVTSLLTALLPRSSFTLEHLLWFLSLPDTT